MRRKDGGQARHKGQSPERWEGPFFFVAMAACSCCHRGLFLFLLHNYARYCFLKDGSGEKYEQRGKFCACLLLLPHNERSNVLNPCTRS